jgi:hypothetical protein
LTVYFFNEEGEVDLLLLLLGRCMRAPAAERVGEFVLLWGGGGGALLTEGDRSLDELAVLDVNAFVNGSLLGNEVK